MLAYTSVFSLKKTDDEFAVEQGDFSAKGTMIPNVRLRKLVRQANIRSRFLSRMGLRKI